MLSINEQKILALLKDTDLVLDVGGWASPFNRADWVIDCASYETRGFYKTIGLPASQGGEKEHFSAKTWVQRDICDREPWPFQDKFFDFSICSQTLEDIRDPLFVCSELKRVSKRGYIEIPSRVAESCRGWERSNIAGLSHHRWLVEVEGQVITFTPKFHMIHGEFDLSLPPSFFRDLTEEQKNTWLFWDGSLEWKENFILGLEAQAEYLRSFVARHHQYPQRSHFARDVQREVGRISAAVARRLRWIGNSKG